MMSCKSKLCTTLKNIFLILLGTFIISISINAVYLPANILSGGITGIALLLHIILGVNSSLIILLFNIPIFIAGYIFMKRRFIMWSIFGMLSLTMFLRITENLVIPSDEIITTILLGGVLYGLGIGLVLKANSSCGGSDIVSKIVNKYFSYSVPSVNLAFNLIVIGLSIYFFDVDTAVLTLTSMYVATLVTKFILEGVAYKRTVFVVSDSKKEIIEEIGQRLHRGCTIINGEGGYTGKEHNLLYCVISINQLAKLKTIIRRCDPCAFINVIESKAVIGNGRGFYSINENEDDVDSKITADVTNDNQNTVDENITS